MTRGTGSRRIVWLIAATAEAASTAVCGASIRVGFTGTKHVALQVDTSRIELPEPTRYPILA